MLDQIIKEENINKVVMLNVPYSRITLPKLEENERNILTLKIGVDADKFQGKLDEDTSERVYDIINTSKSAYEKMIGIEVLEHMKNIKTHVFSPVDLGGYKQWKSKTFPKNMFVFYKNDYLLDISDFGIKVEDDKFIINKLTSKLATDNIIILTTLYDEDYIACLDKKINDIRRYYYNGQTKIITFPAIFTTEEDGITVEFPDVKGAYTCGDNLEEALKNAKECLELALENEEKEYKPFSNNKFVKEDSNKKVYYITVESKINNKGE